jgi:aminoglycoside phosphotransferase (APT) family kinase protein
LSSQAVLLPLSGGTINGAYHLRDGKKEYMVKCFEAADTVKIDRFERFELQRKLAKKRIAPTPLFLSEDGQVYVEQWVRQHRSQIPLFFDELHINHLAKSLSSIHRCDISLPAADLALSWEASLRLIPRANNYTIQQVSQASERWQNLRGVNETEWVLCHNDLAWAHVCIPTKLILDWEYAAMGDRFFDLLSCAKVNKFDNEQYDMLLSAYSAENGIALNIAYEKCAEQAEFVDLTYSLWYQALGLAPP